MMFCLSSTCCSTKNFPLYTQHECVLVYTHDTHKRCLFKLKRTHTQRKVWPIDVYETKPVNSLTAPEFHNASPLNSSFKHCLIHSSFITLLCFVTNTFHMRQNNNNNAFLRQLSQDERFLLDRMMITSQMKNRNICITKLLHSVCVFLSLSDTHSNSDCANDRSDTHAHTRSRVLPYLASKIKINYLQSFVRSR